MSKHLDFFGNPTGVATKGGGIPVKPKGKGKGKGRGRLRRANTCDSIISIDSVESHEFEHEFDFFAKPETNPKRSPKAKPSGGGGSRKQEWAGSSHAPRQQPPPPRPASAKDAGAPIPPGVLVQIPAHVLALHRVALCAQAAYEEAKAASEAPASAVASDTSSIVSGNSGAASSIDLLFDAEDADEPPPRSHVRGRRASSKRKRGRARRDRQRGRGRKRGRHGYMLDGFTVDSDGDDQNSDSESDGSESDAEGSGDSDTDSEDSDEDEQLRAALALSMEGYDDAGAAGPEGGGAPSGENTTKKKKKKKKRFPAVKGRAMFWKFADDVTVRVHQLAPRMVLTPMTLENAACAILVSSRLQGLPRPSLEEVAFAVVRLVSGAWPAKKHCVDRAVGLGAGRIVRAWENHPHPLTAEQAERPALKAAIACVHRLFPGGLTEGVRGRHWATIVMILQLCLYAVSSTKKKDPRAWAARVTLHDAKRIKSATRMEEIIERMPAGPGDKFLGTHWNKERERESTGELEPMRARVRDAVRSWPTRGRGSAVAPCIVWQKRLRDLPGVGAVIVLPLLGALAALELTSDYTTYRHALLNPDKGACKFGRTVIGYGDGEEAVKDAASK